VKKMESIFKFLIKERWIQMACLLIALAIMSILLHIWGFTDVQEKWDLYLNTTVNLVTLLVAIGVWWSSGVREWEDDLPKRLNVTFKDGTGKVIMKCLHAPLGGEGDIRAWSQQLGLQMINNTQTKLDFPPTFVVDAPQIAKDGSCKSYSVTQTLMAVPKFLIDGMNSHNNQPREWICNDNGEVTDSWKISPS